MAEIGVFEHEDEMYVLRTLRVILYGYSKRELKSSVSLLTIIAINTM